MHASERMIGKGSYGKVICVKREASVHVEKRVSIGNQEDQRFLFYELSLLRNLNNLAKEESVEEETKEKPVVELLSEDLLCHGAYEEAKFIFIKLKFYKGDLSKYRRSIQSDEDLKVSVVRQLKNSLVWLHEKKTAHMDIKPQNILISEEGHICLCDFGMSFVFDMSGRVSQYPPFTLKEEDGDRSDQDNWDQDYLITRWYRPAELAKSSSFKRRLSFDAFKQADLWGLGLVIWDLYYTMYLNMAPLPTLFSSSFDDTHLEMLVIRIFDLLRQERRKQERGEAEFDEGFVSAMVELKQDFLSTTSLEERLKVLKRIHPKYWCGAKHPEPELLHLDAEKRCFIED